MFRLDIGFENVLSKFYVPFFTYGVNFKTEQIHLIFSLTLDEGWKCLFHKRAKCQIKTKKVGPKL